MHCVGRHPFILFEKVVDIACALIYLCLMSSIHSFFSQVTGMRTTNGNNYSYLQGDKILLTLQRLHRRIEERFPSSGLGSVCREAISSAGEVEIMLQRIDRPVWILRVAAGIVMIFLIVVMIILLGYMMRLSAGITSWVDLLQTSEAGVNDLIFLSIALWSVLSIESRIKRRALLNSLHRIRSMMHVVDMHQLTKDPAQWLFGDVVSNTDTTSSPKRSMSAFELSRYLDYCSELLSLLSKLAALHAQKENDQIVLEAVNDLEQLAGGLSHKIWQKVGMLERK